MSWHCSRNQCTHTHTHRHTHTHTHIHTHKGHPPSKATHTYKGHPPSKATHTQTHIPISIQTHKHTYTHTCIKRRGKGNNIYISSFLTWLIKHKTHINHMVFLIPCLWFLRGSLRVPINYYCMVGWLAGWLTCWLVGWVRGWIAASWACWLCA